MLNKLFKRGGAWLLIAAVVLCGIGGAFKNSISAEVSEDAVRNAALSYISANGNLSTLAGLLKAVKEVESRAALAEEDYFIYHAVDGVYDEDPDENDRLSIPGHDGYVSAVFTVGEKRIGVIERIFHTEENLGVLTKISTSDSNAAEVFKISKGTLTGVNAANIGKYRKIIIDSNITAFRAFSFSGYTANAEVLIMRNSGKASGNCGQGIFRSDGKKGWVNLKAVYMDDSVTAEAFFSKAKTNYDFSGITTLKYFHFPENGTLFDAGYGDFDGLTSLENVNLGVLKNINNYSFRNAESLYSVYFGKEASRDSFIGGPENRSVMTYAEQQKATFARAAVLAQAAADALKADELENDEKVLQAVNGSYAGKISGVTAAVTEHAAAGELGVSGKVTLTKGDDKLNISISAPKYLKSLDIGVSLTPAFSFDISEYTAEIPFTATSVEVKAIPAVGAQIGTITGNNNFEVDVQQTVEIPVSVSSGESVTYKIKVTRRPAAQTDPKEQAVRAAAAEYVAKNGNDSTAEGILEAVRSVDRGITLGEDGYFIYPAVDGVYDEDRDENDRISIPGHDGYVSAIFGCDGKTVVTLTQIPHAEENLGELTKISTSDSNAADVFIINGKTLTGFNADTIGNYEKIIIDSNITGTNAFDISTYTANAKVLILRNNGENWGNSAAIFRSDGTKGWAKLKAVYVDDSVTVEKFFCRQTNMFNGIPTLKYFHFPENNTRFQLGYGGFANLPSLENVNFGALGTLDTLNHTSFRNASSLYSLYLGENTVYSQFVGLPANAQIMTYAEQQKATFARALCLAQTAADGLSATECAAPETALEIIKGSYSVKAEGVSALWLEEPKKEGLRYKGTLIMSCGGASYGITVNSAIYLKDLNIGYELTPEFSTDVLHYTARVPHDVTYRNINAFAAPGAAVGEITGNTDFVTGVPKTVYIPVTAADGSSVTYTVEITRQEIQKLDSDFIKEIQSYVSAYKTDNFGTESEYTEYLNGVGKRFFVDISVKSFYKYNSVPGACEGEKILVPGHNGYIAVTAEISNGTDKADVPLMSVIAPKMQNYYFTEDEVSKADEFDISEDGKTVLAYNGNAKKIVFPSTVKSVAGGWYSGEHPENVKVIIVPDNIIEIPEQFAYGFNYLEACYLSNGLDQVPGYAFDRCYYLQYLHIPEEAEMIGATAFRYTILPELYIPTTVENIGANAFWNAHTKNYNLPKNISIAALGISYPTPVAGIYAEPDAQPPAMQAELNKIMSGYGLEGSPVTVNMPGDEVTFGAANAIVCSEGRIAFRIHVRANPKLEDTVFKNNLSSRMTYTWLDMDMSEVITRVRVTLDNILIKSGTKPEEIIKAVEDCYCGTAVKDVSWVKPFTVANGVAAGTVRVSSDSGYYDFELNRNIFTSSISSGLDGYVRGKLPFRLELKDNENESREELPQKEPENVSDGDNTSEIGKTTPETPEEPTVIKDIDNKVEIRINKLSGDNLSKKILSQISGKSFMAFDLSVYSEQDVRLNGKLGVALPIPTGFDGELCSVYYIDGNKLRNMKAVKKGNNMLFYTTVFGEYIIVQDKTDYTPFIIAACCAGGVLLLAGGTVIFVVVLKKKKRKKSI